MSRIRCVWSAVWFLAVVGAAEARLSAAEYDLYYLGGQSNMDGFGKVEELPAELKEPVEGVLIFHGNPAPDKVAVDGKGLWQPLRPGHGWEFSSDGKVNKYSSKFGVELTLARSLREKNPGRKIALLKYSRGGTSIHQDAAGNFGCWEPDFVSGDGDGKGINQYDHFLAAVRGAMAVRDIDDDGEEDRLIPKAIFWMQGESDGARTPEIAQQYEVNLKRLMDLIRAAFREDDLPVVIGRISDSGQDANDKKIWDHGEIVREAQASYVKNDRFAALVTTTDKYGYSDPYHYDSAGYIDLGKQFADELLKLQSKAN
jgi:hypothetical protein